MAIFDEKIEIRERCKGVHCVDLGESFPTSIYLHNLASIQARPRLARGTCVCSRSASPPKPTRRWFPTCPTRAMWHQCVLWRWARGTPPPGRRRMQRFASRVPLRAGAAWCRETCLPTLTYCRGQPCRVRGGAHRPREAPRCNFNAPAVPCQILL